MQDKKRIAVYRRDFLDASIEYADQLRVRKRPDVDDFAQKVVEDCGKLVVVRNHLLDWVLLESETAEHEEFLDSLINTLERLRELKARPVEVTSWNRSWFKAHELFVYETFLYLVAGLLKTNGFEYLHEVFASHYLAPATERGGEVLFDTFDVFYAHTDVLNEALAEKGKRYLSPAAELLKRQANRSDISFANLMEADLLILMMALVNPDARWYPQTLHYARYADRFPLFMRASRHRDFMKIARITGVEKVEKLRHLVKAGFDRLGVNQWHDLLFLSDIDLWQAMNMDQLDTLV